MASLSIVLWILALLFSKIGRNLADNATRRVPTSLRGLFHGTQGEVMVSDGFADGFAGEGDRLLQLDVGR